MNLNTHERGYIYPNVLQVWLLDSQQLCGGAGLLSVSLARSPGCSFLLFHCANRLGVESLNREAMNETQQSDA